MLDLNQQYGRSICRLVVFAGRGHPKVIEVMMLTKITKERVKFIGSKYIQESLINMSLQLYISYLNKQMVRLHINISLCLLRSFNTLNSKLKFKPIPINKLQLQLNALYLEATLTFLGFAAKEGADGVSS